jgi:hypothetical protein
MILARTLKGKGIALAEGKPGWHGKAFKKGAELDGVIAALEAQLIPDAGLPPAPPAPSRVTRPAPVAASVGTPGYALGDSVATREAYGAALGKLGADQRVVALDADVKNSTFSEKFEERFRERFHENFIARLRDGTRRAGRDSVPVVVCRVPHPRLRLHPHGGHQPVEHQDGRFARGRIDWRGRPVADGPRRPGHDAGPAEHHRALPV